MKTWLAVEELLIPQLELVKKDHANKLQVWNLNIVLETQFPIPKVVNRSKIDSATVILLMLSLMQSKLFHWLKIVSMINLNILRKS